MTKDIEWLKREVLDNKFMGHTIHIDVLFELMDELDEPEVLSQELPVIPKFVADYIEEGKELGCDLGTAMTVQTEILKNIRDYIKNNEELFARAWLDGYTVEEEQKYYVKIMDKYLTDKGLGIGITFDVLYTSGKKMGYQQQFTEQEIKDYDERYWPFAVKVEELEE